MVIQQPLDPRDSEQQIATREASEKDEIILKVLPSFVVYQTTRLVLGYDVMITSQDLQRAISQADALVKVKKMKLSMTPRLPPLHRRAALDDTATTSEQFGMSLLVPAHQVLEQEATPTNHLSRATISAGERSRVLHQAMSPLLRSPGNGAAAEITSSQHHTTLANTSTTTRIPANTTATAVKERMSLDPAVELAPIAKEVAAEEEEGEGDSSAEELPRIACVMSLMEGQDTASVVEVTADNDVVIETNSSLLAEKPDTVHPPEPSFDDRLTSNNVLPEKEEIVSTTPEDFHEEVEVESVPFALPRPVTLDANHNSMNPGATLDNHHRELNHHVGMAEAELVEMIMKDTELTAWIAKARLRPRTPISYKMTRKKRHSRSRSSSVHD